MRLLSNEGRRTAQFLRTDFAAFSEGSAGIRQDFAAERALRTERNAEAMLPLSFLLPSPLSFQLPMSEPLPVPSPSSCRGRALLPIFQLISPQLPVARTPARLRLRLIVAQSRKLCHILSDWRRAALTSLSNAQRAPTASTFGRTLRT